MRKVAQRTRVLPEPADLKNTCDLSYMGDGTSSIAIDSGIGSSMGMSSWGAPLMRPGGGGSPKKPQSGCFIATAAYGTPFAEEIDVLRRWRDETLLSHALGRLFVRLYYWASPPIAGFIAPRTELRRLTRFVLRVVIEIIWRD